MLTGPSLNKVTSYVFIESMTLGLWYESVHGNRILDLPRPIG